MDGDLGIRPNRRARQRTIAGFQRIFNDLRLNLDIQGHRLDRAVQTQWKKCATVTNRLADALLTKSHQARVCTKEQWSHLIGRVPVQIWWRKAKSEVTQHRHRVMADYRTLQQAAHGSIRRLWQATMPGEEKPSAPARAASSPHPIVLGLTSSGTLKLRSRLEDEGVYPSGQAISEPRGTRSVSNVTVRFIGTPQRHTRESAESKKAERMVKP
jgi:hypothetical protein